MKTIQEQIKKLFLKLPSQDKNSLLPQLQELTERTESNLLSEVKAEFSKNEIQLCPHCRSKEFIGWGKDKGLKRFKCRTCNRTFTEYSGTWVSHIHHKDLLDKYIELMIQEVSIEKIAGILEISVQTSFDWRHKILGAIEKIDKEKFKGITESDETFFLYSEKGKEKKEGESRKRGGKASKKGISSEQVAVMVTTDRKNELDMTVSTLGRLAKKDIEQAIGNRISEETILCTDSHVSYKGFAIEKNLEHHMIKASTKEYVKDKIFHVQHVNSLDSKLKPWINIHFKGVATKYLQNYLNWFRIKELLKKSTQMLRDFLYKSILDIDAWSKFKNIQSNYDDWLLNHAILE